MSERPPRQALQQRVADAILDGAAHSLAARGRESSMSDVAAAAGVARATVYRYFPNRQALLDELSQVALDDAGARLESARIDEVDPAEGVTRAVRALVDVGDYLVAVARERPQPDDDFQRALAAPLRRLFERGQASGDLRGDVPTAWLTELLVALVVSVRSSGRSMGKEDTIAAITSLFLDGARSRRPRSRA